jgi:hypothetical protein
MNTDTARDDLAYMRALVDAPGNFRRSFGEAYFAAGLCYGVQMLLHGVQRFGWLPGEGPIALTIGIGPTVVFMGLLTWIIRRERASRPPAGGAVARAIAAVGSAVGLANLVLIFVIGVVALSEKSLKIWLLYPCTVMVLQAMVWLVIFVLRRRAWFGVVAAGWFLVAAVMAVAIATWNVDVFMITAALGFFAFMLVPGWLIMRQRPIG